MKDRRKRESVSWNRFFWCALFVVLPCALFSVSTFSFFGIFGVSFRPVLRSTWQNQPALKAVAGEPIVSLPVSNSSSLEIQESVTFPDELLIFLKCPLSIPIFTIQDLDCIYYPSNSPNPRQNLPPTSIHRQYPTLQIVRCPIQPRGFSVSIALKSSSHLLPSKSPSRRWDYLAYEALIDKDNTTIVFAKGLNLRPERLSNASRLECVYGWDLERPKYVLRSEALSAAQEIVRCKTPLSLLKYSHLLKSIKVSVRVKGKGTLPSLARPRYRFRGPEPNRHQMCVCTMLRNQARFLKEWVMYHARVGVDRLFIYDNNSNDAIDSVVESLKGSNFNVSRHMWPWAKTQEAGFAHCALRARRTCEWVGFIDVDEFLHLPSNISLHDILRNHSGLPQVAELRTSCHSFGPSGLKHVMSEGVMVAYTCRLSIPERHKSIVRPEALNSTLINVVHHFHLRDGFKYVNVERGLMVINHYKYQAWEVFKEKFYRRVATYVADWQDKENVGSKDRAPGLGTEAIEPSDWSSRFCEVTDTGLRDWVLQVFRDNQTQLFPWQKKY